MKDILRKISTASLIAFGLLAASLMGDAVLAQNSVSPLQNGTPLAPSVTGSDTGAGEYFGTNRAGITGHPEFSNKGLTAPSLTGCGTGTISANSSDAAGQVTATGATACVVNFALPFNATPICVASDFTTAAALKVTPSTTTAAISGLTSGDVFQYMCVGRSGG